MSSASKKIALIAAVVFLGGALMVIVRHLGRPPSPCPIQITVEATTNAYRPYNSPQIRRDDPLAVRRISLALHYPTNNSVISTRLGNYEIKRGDAWIAQPDAMVFAGFPSVNLFLLSKASVTVPANTEMLRVHLDYYQVPVGWPLGIGDPRARYSRSTKASELARRVVGRISKRLDAWLWPYFSLQATNQWKTVTIQLTVPPETSDDAQAASNKTGPSPWGTWADDTSLKQ